MTQAEGEAEEMDIAKLTDDALRSELFDRIAERLKAESDIEPKERKPHLFSLSRHGNMLTVFQAGGAHLMRGELQWKHRPDGDQDEPWIFKVSRAVDKSRLQLVTVGGPTEEGTIDEVLDNIVTTFLTKTEPEEATE